MKHKELEKNKKYEVGIYISSIGLVLFIILLGIIIANVMVGI